MIDKSVLLCSAVMVQKSGSNIPEVTLPEGYRIVFYQAGDEHEWARLETSVGEFRSETEALARFMEEFGEYPEELQKRCLFVENPAGEKCGTVMAWFGELAGVSQNRIHWLSVAPQQQGKKLGKALLACALAQCNALSKDVPIYLTTSTASWRAVGMYLKFGFEPYEQEKDFDAWNIIFKKLRGE